MSTSSGFWVWEFFRQVGRSANAIRCRAAYLAVLVLILLCNLLAGCGGGTLGNGGTGVTPPSNLIYSQAAINAAVEFPMTPDAPTVTGSVTNFSVTPTLPAGMAINTTTGVISGTPTAVSAKANYTVTASNAGGATTTVLQIAVTLTAPDKLVYPQTTINATAGVGIQPDIPSVEGVVTAYSVNPALPPGLSVDTTTGAITGTPTVASSTATYTVTASNATGSTTATLQITVSQSPPSNLIYPQTTINAIVGTAIATDAPSVTGVATGYSVSPALPAGLTLNTTTGAIAGTPTAASATAA